MNSTVIDYSLCTYATCDVSIYGQLRYIPSLPGNAFYLAIFALYLICQTGLGIYYRTYGYLIGMFCGLALEIVGYSARILLHFNDFNNDYFIIYLVGLTIGPAFFSASIYLCLGRIIAIYGHNISFISARIITIIFCCFDFISLLLQATGGAMVSLANDDNMLNTGLHIMTAGLSTQVASTSLFTFFSLYLTWNVSRNPTKVNPNSRALRHSRKFRFFLFAIGIANIAILVRCCFRLAELNNGFSSALANNEVLFMILDGAMMVISTSLLTFAHPGIILGSLWKDGAFHFRKSKQTFKNEHITPQSSMVERRRF